MVRKRFLALGAGAAVVFLALTPTGCYLSRGAWEEGRILARRRPIVDLVRDPALDPAVGRKLALVLAARAFARDSLGLRVNESFTTYSPIDRDTLVLVLSAAYRDRLEPRTWWFPIVGRVPYKGYFDFGAARRAAQRLLNDGFDVYLRPSDAFSTLGWFNDPLLSTTLARDSLDLVDTVIHELTHNTYYASGQAVFNESFASFVGARGAAAFFASRGAGAAARDVEAQWHDQKLLGAFWRDLARAVDSAYAVYPMDSTRLRLRARDSVYALARQRLVSELSPRFQRIPESFARRVQLDNAALLARRVYARDLHLFDAVYQLEGGDLRKSLARLIQIASSRPEDPFAALRESLGPAAAEPERGGAPEAGTNNSVRSDALP